LKLPFSSRPALDLHSSPGWQALGMDGKSFRRYFGAIVLGIGIVLIGFNYWHLMTCVKSESHLNLDEILPVYQQRVLEIESQV
jgi:hypothetical protein